ncbi:MAG: thioredoxin family protein [Candidatus Nanoarchaeia archaeon]|nr:thioredoxin family protein [Candidatus Nanoarchaeia archaeon]
MIKAGLLAVLASFSLSDSVHNVTPDNFNDSVLNNPKPVVVDFYAGWCGSCPEMKYYFNEICEENSRLYCAGYDFDSGEEIPATYGVDPLPAFRFFCNGKEDESRRIDGAIPKEQLESKILDFLDNCN